MQQIDALEPDIVLIARDLVSDKQLATRRHSVEDAVARLAGLRAKLRVLAGLGNHDHWRLLDLALRRM